MANTDNQKTNREHKDTLFRTLFSDSKNFLELYNAAADENIPIETEVTLHPSNELLNRFNDLAASIGDRLIVFFEHQSTFSPNMPLRFLSFVTDILYLHLVNKDKLYGSTLVKMPTPRFYVLYNGEQKRNIKRLFIPY
ncbi:MAG: Rpn family recombination-promoting nuclease/putative transposase [Oscillospiraceae bacterium]|nr:Rpn family recombination-promoting nuclease/putative transposase [Oscillospiraceae bacterium]